MAEPLKFWISTPLLACSLFLVFFTGCQSPPEKVFPGKDWEIVSPESQGLDSEILNRAIRYLEAHSGENGVSELVIVRNGRIVWHGNNIDHQHGVWSMTKSIVSTTLGLLIEDGKCSLNSKASNHLPQMKPNFKDITLQQFTTMTSGYLAEGDDRPGNYRHGPSRTPFIPAAQPFFPPGTGFAYWDSAMNQFANTLTHIAGEPLDSLFRRRIANPIGMDSGAWHWGDFGIVDGLKVNGGAGNNGNHIYITAREMARFGVLYLNNGKWRDKQLIREEWIQAATSVQVRAPFSWKHPESGIDGRGYYGYNWWRNGVGANSSRKWPGAPPSTFAASGFNNNDLFVIPKWDMVIVRLGLDESSHKITDKEYGEFIRQVGTAIK